MIRPGSGLSARARFQVLRASAQARLPAAGAAGCGEGGSYTRQCIREAIHVGSAVNASSLAKPVIDNRTPSPQLLSGASVAQDCMRQCLHSVSLGGQGRYTLLRLGIECLFGFRLLLHWPCFPLKKGASSAVWQWPATCNVGLHGRRRWLGEAWSEGEDEEGIALCAASAS